MNLTCYIADDEHAAISVLSDYIAKTPGLELAGASTNALIALEEITALKPAVVLLDVDMAELSGLELAGMVHLFTIVIFTTAYREYGPEAFEKEAADYLLKPVGYDRFLRSIQKVRKRLALPAPAKEPAPAFFFVKSGVKGKMTRVVVSEIVYITGAVNYIELHLNGRKIMTYLTLAEVMDQLPQEHFSRIHKSYIVNHCFIRSIEYAQVRLTGDTVLPVGRAYRKDFRNKMNSSFLLSKRDQAG
jgi:DNA-binding LytR/AlgR family response regulator